jgi:hypothetical protein
MAQQIQRGLGRSSDLHCSNRRSDDVQASAAHQIEDKLARTFAWMCFIALPVAQVSWIVAVIREVPMLGSLMDNVWTIYNFASLLCIMLLLHRREEN